MRIWVFLLVFAAVVFLAGEMPASTVTLVPKNDVPRDEALALSFGNDVVVIRDEIPAPLNGRILASGVDRGKLFLVRDRRRMDERTGYVSLYARTGFHVALVEDANRLRAQKDVRVLPIEGSRVVISRGEKADIAPDPVVEGTLERLNEQRYAGYLQELSDDLATRFACSNEALDARDLIAGYFDDLGLAADTPQFFNPCFFCDRTQGYNVVGIKAGKVRPEEIYVVGAHFDSMSEDPCRTAPGANDNASGTAGVLELARVFAGLDTEASILFAAFDTEELGLIGSSTFVQTATAGGLGGEINAFLVLDMISFYADNFAVFLEGSDWLPNQAEILYEIVALAGTYTDLAAEYTTDYWGSDHEPFLDKGYGGALLIEKDWDQYAPYHTSGDVFDAQETGYGLEILKLAAAALATWAVVLPPEIDDDVWDDTSAPEDDTAPENDDAGADDDRDDDERACGC